MATTSEDPTAYRARLEGASDGIDVGCVLSMIDNGKLITYKGAAALLAEESQECSRGVAEVVIIAAGEFLVQEKGSEAPLVVLHRPKFRTPLDGDPAELVTNSSRITSGMRSRLSRGAGNALFAVAGTTPIGVTELGEVGNIDGVLVNLGMWTVRMGIVRVEYHSLTGIVDAILLKPSEKLGTALAAAASVAPETECKISVACDILNPI